MLKFCCVKAGDKYDASYVNKLYAMIARNLEAGVEGRFYCFTDDPTGIREEVHCVALPPDLEGWWAKLWLFGPHHQFDEDDRIVYFDLDTVIVGDLDEIVKYNGEFAILRDFYRPDGWQSSVILWRGGFGDWIWGDWVKADQPRPEGGDQAWLECVVIWADILQDKFSGKFCSYKEHCKPYPPEGTSVVVFHGQPKPDNCGQAWVEAMWSESDAGHFDLKMIANVTLDEIRAQSRASAARGLRRLRSQPAREGKVVLVGGGPSLKDAITLYRLRDWKASGAAIWAMNGTLSWLLDNGIEPDAFVLLDARADNIRFIDARFEGTHYLASQCHPLVYDTLSNHQVVRYDLDVMGDCGTTVGTYAIAIAFVEGFRDIHLVGYDSSYRGDDGHGYHQGLNAAEKIIDAHIGDKTFRAAPWMAQQANDFPGVAGAIIAAGAEVYVHGDGLLPEVAKSMIPAARVRAQEVLRRLPADAHWIQGAEIGVFTGAMSAELLTDSRVQLMMVDSWEPDGAAYINGDGDFHAELDAADQWRFKTAAIDVVRRVGWRALLADVRSDVAASKASDGIYDFVFIDADHSYEGCATDIDLWHPKLKENGLLCGHDYDQPDFPGVKRAVDEFAVRHGYAVELGENFTWFIRL